MADRYLNPQTGQVAEWDQQTGQWKIGSARPEEVPVAQGTLGAPLEAFKRTAQGFASIPGFIGQSFSQIPQIEPSSLVNPGILASTARGTLSDLLQAGPEIVGGAVGSFAGPGGLVAGPIAGRLTFENLKQLLTGVPQAPLETLTRGATAGVQSLAGVGLSRAQQLAALARGRGAFTPSAGLQGAFERQAVEPTLADVTGSRIAARAENISGGMIGGSGVVQRAQQAQQAQMGEAFSQAVEGAGGIGTRAGVGLDIRRGVLDTLEQMKQAASRLRGAAEQAIPEGMGPGTENLRAVANKLADEIDLRHPALKDTKALSDLRALGSPGTAAKVADTGLLDESGKPITKIVEPAADLTKTTFAGFEANQQAIGEILRELKTVVGTIPQGRAKALYAATVKDLDAFVGDPAIPEAARPAVTLYKEFYKKNIAEFNESTPGRLASGEIDVDQVSQLFTKKSLDKLQEVKRFAPGDLFIEARNRWLGDIFRDANVVDPERGFQMGNFRRAWNSIDPEVRARAFTAGEQSNFNDLATISERIGKKFTAQGGGNPPGSGITVGTLFQAGEVMGAVGKTFEAMMSGEPLAAALSAGAVAVGVAGPYGLAKLVTSPGGIRYLTQAFQTPVYTAEGLALLGRISEQIRTGAIPGQSR